jgi:hypothetical protein
MWLNYHQLRKNFLREENFHIGTQIQNTQAQISTLFWQTFCYVPELSLVILQALGYTKSSST